MLIEIENGLTRGHFYSSVIEEKEKEGAKQSKARTFIDEKTTSTSSKHHQLVTELRRYKSVYPHLLVWKAINARVD